MRPDQRIHRARIALGLFPARMVTGPSRKEARALSFRNTLACQLGWKLASVRIISVGSCRLWGTTPDHHQLVKIFCYARPDRTWGIWYPWKTGGYPLCDYAVNANGNIIAV